MTIVPEPLNSRVQEAGWIPIEVLGEGGGGKVYLCVKAELIRMVENVMGGSGAVTQPQRRFETSANFIRSLNKSLVGDRDALVALKIPKAIDDPATRERLKREIAAMNIVSHPALIRILGSDRADSPEWFVMECHRRGTLAESVQGYSGRIVETIKAIQPIASAVQLLHGSGYVHRDIKPNNIFVSDNNDLVLGDLGIVFPRDQAGERLTESGMTLFSRDWIPDWMRFTDATPQPKVDVFMIGKVIYFMVTGGQRVLASQLDDEPFDLRHRLKEEGAAELQEILMECITTKENNCKYADARSFAVRLEELLRSLTGRVQERLIFSFVSPFSTTDVPIREGLELDHPRFASLTRLQVFFQNKCKRLRIRARINGNQTRGDFNLFMQINGHPMTLQEGARFEVTPNHERGVWTNEFVVSLTVPIDRGWHALDVAVTCRTQGYSLSGFMLYGE